MCNWDFQNEIEFSPLFFFSSLSFFFFFVGYFFRVAIIFDLQKKQTNRVLRLFVALLLFFFSRLTKICIVH